MSDAHAVRLVDEGDTSYERFAMAVVAGSFAAFVFAAAVLFDWASVEGNVGGVPTATYVGGAVLLLGLATGALGVFSRWGGVQTEPDRSPGLVVGLVQTMLWLLTVGLLARNLLGLGRVGWLVGLLAGAAVGYLTVGRREDVGATLPAAAFICLVGAVFLAGLVPPAWTWEPPGFGATIPGIIVIPVLTMVTSLLSGWAGASATEGFGSRGRQNGAFLLISLVVLLTLSVLVFLILFVFQRGIMVVLENLTIGAGSALLALLTVFGLLVQSRSIRPQNVDGTEKVTAFVSLGIIVAVGLLTVVVAGTIVTSRTLAGAGVTLVPTTGIGAMPGLLVGGVVLFALRQSDAYTPDGEMARRVNVGLRLAGVLLAVSLVVELFTWSEFALAGVAIIPSLAMLVLAVAAGLFALRLTDRNDSDALTWVPPLTRSGKVALWAFLALCLHVAITDFSFLVGPVGVVAGGTVEWPFVMNPSQGLGIQKGVMPAMLGTVWIVLGAVVFAVPLAVGAAVFLTEYAEDSLFTRAVDIATNGLWSTPSIVFGLFGLAFLVPRFGGSPSIFVSQLVLGFMLLPLVLITSREAMKSVPDEYRDASAALGVSKWDTIRSVVIPAAMPGVITGVILGVGRIAGETAPLLLVLNGPNFPNAGPGVLTSFTVEFALRPPFIFVSNPALLDRASALPYQLYAIITAGVGAEQSFGWGTTLVLIGVVLSFFAMGVASRRYFRRKLHQ